MPVRQAVARRQARVREIMHTLPPAAQEAIRDDLEGTHKSTPSTSSNRPSPRHRSGGGGDAPTATIAVAREVQAE
jgi:phospholipid/cholesterol/gamma-HCH transport system ATP-binding protein